MQRLTSGQVFRGRYVLEVMLGRGGMGSVWRARDRSLGRDVTLKFMAARLEGSAIARKRFEREAHATARLQSRHVVRVHDHGVEEATPFIVMELLEGEDLAARILRVGRLPVEDATRVVLEVCRGLRAAHEAGLVHRDLKPANIFLARQADGTEIAKILDFGVVKATASTFEASVVTESGAIVGSVQYASPEQAEGHRDLDARSDLWSVTAVAFRMLTGRLPFPGEALGAVVLAICSRPLPRATEVAPELPPALDSFFARGFERDRAARFQSAMELADALATAAGGVDLRSVEPSREGDGDPAAVTRIVDLAGDATRLMMIGGVAAAARNAAQVDVAGSTEEVAEEEYAPTRLIEPPSELGTTTGVSAVASTAVGRVRAAAPPWLPLVGLVALAAAIAAGVGGWIAGGGGRAPLPDPASAATGQAPLHPPRDGAGVLSTAPAPEHPTLPASAQPAASAGPSAGASVRASASASASAPPRGAPMSVPRRRPPTPGSARSSK